MAAETDPFVDSLGDNSPSPSSSPSLQRTGHVAVVGGAMGGLAAAHALDRLGYDVTLYERQSYEKKAVHCGEAITDAGSIPLAKTAANGFPNAVPEFEVRVYTGEDETRSLAGTGVFPAADGYVADRDRVEMCWAEQLTERGVDVREGTTLTASDVTDLASEMDLVVDATGQPSVTNQLDGGGEYVGQMTALNADVEGDFTDIYPRAIICFENFLGYAWAFPKTERRANVGIGWASESRPEDYMSAFETACQRNGWPVPDRSAVSVDTIPRGPSLDPDRIHLPDHGVVRVGDAAGIANRFTGKGISQAVESSYLLGRCLAHDDLSSYPERLYDQLRMEYLLAYVVRGALADGRVDILAETMEVVTGIDVETVDRIPRHALARIIRKPRLVSKIITNRQMVSRLYRALRGQWEFTRQSDA